MGALARRTVARRVRVMYAAAVGNTPFREWNDGAGWLHLVGPWQLAFRRVAPIG
jgi:hypothetical protein